MVALLLVAASLGLSDFAASIAIGISDVDRQLRVRISLAFGLFEAGMPIVGLLLGHRVSHALGSRAHIIGGARGFACSAGLFLRIRAGSALAPRAAADPAFEFFMVRVCW